MSSQPPSGPCSVRDGIRLSASEAREKELTPAPASKPRLSARTPTASLVVMPWRFRLHQTRYVVAGKDGCSTQHAGVRAR